MTQQKPPRKGQKSMGRARCSSWNSGPTPPVLMAVRRKTVPSSPNVKMVTNESGFMPLM